MEETSKSKEDHNIKQIPKNKDNQMTSGLKKCFTALVDRKQVSLDIDVLRIILKYELSINVESLDENLTSVLPFMLVFYIKSWPGWQKSKEYYSGKLNFREWFEKFRQYVVVKINYVIKNGYDVALGMIKDEWQQTVTGQNLPTNVKNHGAQTDHWSSQIFAPFSISIQGKPTLIGSMRFDVDNEDICIRHNKEVPMTEIGMTELLNWPYVTLEFVSPELSFKRSNCVEHIRFLSMSTSNVLKKPDFIEHVEIIDPSNGRHCYTARLLKGYIKQYMSILKLAKDIPSLTIKKYETILVEFLKDIDEIGMNATIATNTSVLFNIGKNQYLRTRSSGSYPSIMYHEQYTPKMETSLYYFKGIQDTTTPEISFSYLNILQASIKNMNNTARHLGQGLPTIIYGCNYCTRVFNADQMLLAHLRDCHKFEPNLKCVKCDKYCSIKQLASSRWQHSCQENVK